MTGKPRLLFLTFYFPPLPNVACVRAFSIVKYLSLSDWEVTVVTPDPVLWRVSGDVQNNSAELERWGVHTILTGHRWRFLSSGHLKRSYNRGPRWVMEGIPRRVAGWIGVDEMAGWYPEVERACATLRPGDVDIILATGSPFGTFRIARRLGRLLRCPYVLDYRDLWTDNPHAKRGKRRRTRRTERRLLQDSAAVTVVSPSMAEYLGGRYGIRHKTHVVHNGYDPDDFRNIRATEFGHFAIMYAGLLYPPKSSVAPLMLALRQLAALRTDDTWRFHYYGPQGELVRNEARSQGLEGMLEDHGMVPRDVVLSALRGAGCALIITSVFDSATRADLGILTGKIYEAIGLGTPLLVIAPVGSDVETVVRVAGRGAVFTGSNAEGMAAFLDELMQGGTVERKQPEAYAWPKLILKMDCLLRSALRSFPRTASNEDPQAPDSP